jgi:NADH-quinone oxidoreductase subunit F
MSSVLGRIESGDGKEGDVDLLLDIAGNIAGKTFCPLGDGASIVLMNFIKHFREEFEEHIRQKGCPLRETKAA